MTVLSEEAHCVDHEERNKGCMASSNEPKHLWYTETFALLVFLSCESPGSCVIPVSSKNPVFVTTFLVLCYQIAQKIAWATPCTAWATPYTTYSLHLGSKMPPSPNAQHLTSVLKSPMMDFGGNVLCHWWCPKGVPFFWGGGQPLEPWTSSCFEFCGTLIFPQVVDFCLSLVFSTTGVCVISGW